MNFDVIKEFANEHHIDAIDLLAAAQDMMRDNLVAKLKECNGFYSFSTKTASENGYDVPYVICRCFNAICELRVSFVRLNGNNEIEIACIDDSNNAEYILSLSDLVVGQVQLILNSIFH